MRSHPTIGSRSHRTLLGALTLALFSSLIVSLFCAVFAPARASAQVETVLATDDFNRPNETPVAVGGDWQQVAGAGSSNLIGHHIAGVSSEAVFGWQGAGSFDDARQFARARVVQSTGGELGLTLLTASGQAIIVAWEKTSGNVLIFYYSGGTPHPALTAAPSPIVPGDVVEAVLLDGMIYAKVNGQVVASATNTTGLTAGRPGFQTYLSGSILDDWEAGTPAFYTIGGTVLENAVGLPGVQISASGHYGGSTVTDANGEYTLTSVPGGASAVVLKTNLAGHTLSPATQTIAGPVAANVGGIDFTSTASGNALVAFDDFDRGVELPLQVGGNWQKAAGTGVANLADHQLVGVGSADVVYFWQGPGVFDPNRQSARATVVATTGQVGLALLASSGQAIVAAWDRNVSTLFLYWYSGGVIQGNLATASSTIQPGDVIEAELLDGTIYAKVNGVVVASAVNSTSIATGRPGFELFRAGGRLDGWEGRTPAAYTLRGTIRESAVPVPGVQVVASGFYGRSTTTDANGDYAFASVPAGASSILITPNLAGREQTPLTRSVPGPIAADVLGLDFESAPANNPLIAFDRFDRPAEGSFIVGGDWQKSAGAGNASLATNQVVGTTGEALYTWQGPGVFDDARQAARAHVGATTGEIGLSLLGSPGQALVVAWKGAPGTLRIFWYSGGVAQSALATASAPIQVGDLLEALVLDGTIYAKVNGVVVASAVNSTPIVSGRPGFATPLAGGRLDDWEAITPPSYTLHGTITENAADLPGVLVRASGHYAGRATTDANGDYTLSGVPAGASAIRLTPTLAGHVSSPTERVVAGPVASNVSSLDFTSTPSSAPLVATDDFDRPSESPLVVGLDWQKVAGAGTANLDQGQLVGVGADAIYAWQGAGDFDDASQSAQARVVSTVGQVGLALLASSGQAIVVAWNQSIPTLVIYWYSGGVIQGNLATVASSIQAGDRIEAELLGGVVYAKVNGVVVASVANTTPLTTGRPGFEVFRAGGRIDDWEAGLATARSIHGTITENGLGLPGVLVAATGLYGKTATTDVDGQYTLTNVPTGASSIVLKPTLAFHAFAPVSRTVAGPVAVDVVGQDFTSTPSNDSVVAYDDFDRPAEQPLLIGGNWAKAAGAGNVDLVGHEITGLGPEAAYFWQGPGSFDDLAQFARARVGGSTGQVGLVLLGGTGHGLVAAWNRGSSTLFLYWYANGNYQGNLTTVSSTIQAGDVVEAELLGGVFSAKVNGVVVASVPNTTTLSSGRPGFEAFGVGGRLDDWAAGIARFVCQNGSDDDGDGLVDLFDPGCASASDTSEQDPGLACDDGADNDGDLLVDVADPGCASPADPSEQNAAIACDDGVDNDGDTLVDLADPDCLSPTDPFEGIVLVACNDGLDNDGDGLADAFDPGCTGASDTSEQDPGLACDDGADNDGDLLVDVADPGCASPADPSEQNAAVQCDDGLDNDQDTLVDLADPDCTSATDPQEGVLLVACNDGLDNDGDGLADLVDPGCSAANDTSEQDPGLVCDDGVDNDADGFADLSDPGCASPADASEQNAAIACDDGVDNDGDALADTNDPGCAGPADASEQNAAIACDDGIDNDGDSLADVADPGCANVSDASEQNAAIACDDGIDNDGDGFADTSDPGCTGPADVSEQNAAFACDDGLDNDGDSLVDFPADPQCTSVLDTSEAADPNVPMLPPAGVALLAGALVGTAGRALRRRASER